jgi:branched-chain amino acid transport system permease protein
MPSWEDFKPFVVTGLALGGVYALSGVGMVVLYRATGVLNLAFGAVGAMGALLAWQLINVTHAGPRAQPSSSAFSSGRRHAACTACSSVPRSPGGIPLVKATATLGLALILLGIMYLVWSDKARSMICRPRTTGSRSRRVRQLTRRSSRSASRSRS